MRKTTRKKIAPIAVTVAVVLYVGPLVLAVLAIIGGLFGEGGLSLFPLVFLAAYLLLGGAVIIGVVRALLQRLDEIDGGEEEEASQY
nr:hypothetical protein [uncultured Oscillibacter sp.]